MKKLHPILTVILTFATLALAALTMASCATMAHRSPTAAAASTSTTSTTASSDTPADNPVAAEVKPIDPLARILTSPKFVTDATHSLDVAGTTDPMFTQCVTFTLALGQELTAKPLLSMPQLAIASVDPSCPLCLLAAKRKDLEALQSGVVTAQVAAVRARVRDIETRAALACGPLVTDERAVILRLAAIFGGAGAF